MKNKIFCLLLIVLLVNGCGKIENNKTIQKTKDVKKEDVIPTYQDENDTPISFYQLKGNTLIKVNDVHGNFNPLDDILFLQVYPSNLENITLTDNFGTSFYEEYMKYQQKNPIKIGFNITYTVNGEKISHNILTPNNTMDHWEYFMAYLYDDYVNLGKGFYSHIENDEYTDSTLFTSFKLQCGAYCLDASDITLSVFTYDGEDDFSDNTYRGDSKASLSICLKGNC